MPPAVDLGRLTRGEAIAAGSALVLFVAMFLPWFSEKAPVEVPGLSTIGRAQDSHHAWTSFAMVDVLLFLVVLLALAVAVAHAAGVLPSDTPVPPALLVMAAGGLAVLLILYRLVDPPAATIEVAIGQADVGRRIGVFLGLLAAAGIGLGGYLALTEGSRGR